MRVIFSTSQQLLDKFDSWIKGRYDTRSEALRAAMKRLMNEEARQK